MTLRTVRGKLAHKFTPSFTDQECNDLFDQIETAVAGLNLPSYTDRVKECRNNPRTITNEEISVINHHLRLEWLNYIIPKAVCVLGALMGLILAVLFQVHQNTDILIINGPTPVKKRHYFPDTKIVPYFVGRQNEISDTIESILNGSKLEIFAGSPGFGKTTTAMVIGKHLRDEHGFEVSFVDLKKAHTESDVREKMSLSLGISLQTFSRPEFLFALRKRIQTNRTLIILDNIEQLLLSAEQQRSIKTFIKDILESSNLIQLLCTSRKTFYHAHLNPRVTKIGQLNAIDSAKMLLTISPSLSKAEAIELGLLCRGVPLLLALFGTSIKANYGLTTASDMIREINRTGVLEYINPDDEISEYDMEALLQTHFDMLGKTLGQGYIALYVIGRESFSVREAEAVVPKSVIKQLLDFNILGKGITYDMSFGSNKLSMHPVLREFAQSQCYKTEEAKTDCAKVAFSLFKFYNSITNNAQYPGRVRAFCFYTSTPFNTIPPDKKDFALFYSYPQLKEMINYDFCEQYENSMYMYFFGY